jgi:hypothetical protein
MIGCEKTYSMDPDGIFLVCCAGFWIGFRTYMDDSSAKAVGSFLETMKTMDRGEHH